jgi:hypothetical protein
MADEKLRLPFFHSVAIYTAPDNAPGGPLPSDLISFFPQTLNELAAAHGAPLQQLACIDINYLKNGGFQPCKHERTSVPVSRG